MGKIHDKIKARQQRINAIVVSPGLERHKPDTAREISVLFEDLARIRVDRTLGSGDRHGEMQILAAQAQRLGLKGRWNLLCNRTQCLRPDATWYNRGSHAFYCSECARELNEDTFNAKEAQRMFGEGFKLCYRVGDSEEASQLHVS